MTPEHQAFYDRHLGQTWFAYVGFKGEEVGALQLVGESRTISRGTSTWWFLCLANTPAQMKHEKFGTPANKIVFVGPSLLPPSLPDNQRLMMFVPTHDSRPLEQVWKPLFPLAPVVDSTRYPHVCVCGAPAYIGCVPAAIACSSAVCRHAEKF